jgi:hypothetical protein
MVEDAEERTQKERRNCFRAMRFKTVFGLGIFADDDFYAWWLRRQRVMTTFRQDKSTFTQFTDQEIDELLAQYTIERSDT